MIKRAVNTTIKAIVSSSLTLPQNKASLFLFQFTFVLLLTFIAFIVKFYFGPIISPTIYILIWGIIIFTSFILFETATGLFAIFLVSLTNLYFLASYPLSEQLTQTLSLIFFGLIVLSTLIIKKVHQNTLYQSQKLVNDQLKTALENEKNARLMAEDAIRSRDEFLKIASHELKNPLTTILLQLQATLHSILNQSLANFSGEKLVKSLTTAEQQTTRLEKLIKDLLNVSLVSTGKLQLELEEMDLSEIVKNTTSRFDEQLKQQGCILTFHTDGQVMGLWDQVRMEQAITNLLTNAIKFGKGKPIEVTVKKHGNLAKVSVSDQGVGIDPNDQKLIFERFKRGTGAEKFNGLGVGLFIVKQIIEAHGGKVDVSSTLNRGSTFSLELPINNDSKSTSVNYINLNQRQEQFKVPTSV